MKGMLPSRSNESRKTNRPIWSIIQNDQARLAPEHFVI